MRPAAVETGHMAEQNAAHSSTMMQLFRLTRLADRFDTQVFSFMVPPDILTDRGATELPSRDFIYGHQKWCIYLQRQEKHLAVFVQMKNISEGMACTLDFAFTMVNKEHFTRNETVVERACTFTPEKTIHGRRTFVAIQDLSQRGFLHDNGHFLLELELRAIRTVFEQVIQLPKESKEVPGVPFEYDKHESNYFTFGQFDWNLSLHPFGDCPETDGRPLVHLVRQTSFGHLCRVQYRLTLGQGDRSLESDTIEQIINTSGTGDPYDIGYNMYKLTSNRCRLKVKIELFSVTAISEVQLEPFTPGKNRVHLYDRDKQAWMLESDVADVKDCLRLRLYYADVHNVPRDYIRQVCWDAGVLPYRSHYVKPVRVIGSPFCNYHSQTETDVGYEMLTNIPIKEVWKVINGRERLAHYALALPAASEKMGKSRSRSPHNNHRLLQKEGGYAGRMVVREEPKKAPGSDSSDVRRITVHVEWIDSHLLYHSKYDRLDEITAKHKHQMWREIMALQAENYALEKQLYSYQQSIAQTSGRARTGYPGEDDVTPPSSNQTPSHTPPIGGSPVMSWRQHEPQHPVDRSAYRDRHPYT